MLLFEDFSVNKEYFMVTWMEDGDEIHMTLVNMIYYKEATQLIPNWNEDLTPFIEFIDEHQEGQVFVIQTFCNQNFPFTDYKIVKVIHIPMI